MTEFVLVFRLRSGEEPKVRYSSLKRRVVRNLRTMPEPLCVAYEALSTDLVERGYHLPSPIENWDEVLESGEPFIWFFERHPEIKPVGLKFAGLTR